jgi:hypothetical protein
VRRDGDELDQQPQPLRVHALHRGRAPGERDAADGVPLPGGPGGEVRGAAAVVLTSVNFGTRRCPPLMH